MYPLEVSPLVEIPDFEAVPTPIRIPFPKPFVPDGDDGTDEADETLEEKISKMIMQNLTIVVGGVTTCLVLTMLMCCCCCRSKRVVEEENPEEREALVPEAVPDR